MKILVLSNLYPPDIIGGYELFCRQSVEALRSRGHDVLVLTTAPRKAVPAEPGVRRVFRLHDIWDPSIHNAQSMVSARLRLGHSSLIDAFNVHALIEEVRAFRPDVAYLHNTLMIGGLGLLAALQHLGIPWVWHLEDSVPAYLCLKPGFRIVAPEAPEYLTREFEAQARGHFLACSQGVVDEIEQYGISLRDRVTLLTNWVTTTGNLHRDDYRPGGTLRMVTAGRLDHSKGIDIAIEACRLLRDRGHRDFSLDIYGIGKEVEFRILIQKAGLGDAVRLMGQRSHETLLQLYANYDVFLFPTASREPFGMAPLEASAQGCVSILSHKNGVGEWLMDGVHCYKARRSPEAFAEVLQDLLEGRRPLAEVGRRAARVIANDFHVDKVIATVERHLVEQAGRRREPTLSPEDLYRLALFAEKFMICQIQRPQVA